jgi:hypothetical protein
MGGETKGAGGVPAQPTKTLKEQRADLIHVFVATLDKAIDQSETNPDFKGVPVKSLTADISFEYPKDAIKSRVVIDLAQDIPTQINTKVVNADDTQPPTDTTTTATTTPTPTAAAN